MARKATWIHITFSANQDTHIMFDKSIWEDEHCLLKHRWSMTLTARQKPRIKRFIRNISACKFRKQILLTWNGYSLLFMRVQ
jgi:hypothetical protein